MITAISFFLFAFLGFTLVTPTQEIQAPPTKTVDQVDTYFGTEVADPYRWLEDDNSADTAAWVEAQNRVTFDYLGQIPERKWIRERMTALWNFERYGVPVKKGKYYFFLRNSGLQNQDVLYVTESLRAEPRLLLDPNTLSEDGTVALATTSTSSDGRLLVYGTSASGSDWQEWFVRDVATGKDLPDHLNWIKFSAASFDRDSTGFYYSRYAEPDPKEVLTVPSEGQMVYFHRLGTPQSEDRLIYERPDRPKMYITPFVTDDGRYLCIILREGTNPRNRFYYIDLQSDNRELAKLIDEPDAAYQLIDNDGPVMYFRTDLEAPNYRIIAIDTRTQARRNWKTIVPEASESMEDANIVGHEILANYLKDAHSEVRVFSLDGKHLRDVDLPGIGSASGFSGRASDEETFYRFTSFTMPNTVYRYDTKTGRSEVFKRPRLAYSPEVYETKTIFYTSKDGTRVPMFLTYRKGIRLNGQNPTLLYGYGGFNSAVTPSFSVPILLWLEMGGVYAAACLRGGSEYGEEWHEAGTKLKKQNVFDDFIAAAEWLISNKYTSASKLAIYGRSNGGLLVGAVLTQRPELFGATLPAVGVMDMLRFHKFTAGWGWTSDYGSSEESPEQFQALLKYSPLHNLKHGVKYPPTLITTSDHDDRVVPAHSFKFAAAMQAAQGGEAPVLIRIETKAGHGGDTPVSKLIELYTDQWGFLVRNLHMAVPQ